MFKTTNPVEQQGETEISLIVTSQQNLSTMSDIHTPVSAPCTRPRDPPPITTTQLPLDTPTAAQPSRDTPTAARTHKRTDGRTVAGTRAKRTRTKYSSQQLERLETIFEGNQYPDTALQEELATDMGVTMEKISIWFQNRRSKFKRESKSSHVMWMRKQIFDGGDDGRLSPFPYGSPRLPDLTRGLCHVLSPPESTLCSRHEMSWDTPAAIPSCMSTHQDPTSCMLDLRTTPNVTSTDLSYLETSNHGNTTYNENLAVSNSVFNSSNCEVRATTNMALNKHVEMSSSYERQDTFGTVSRTLRFPLTTNSHHSNRTSTPNSCRMATSKELEFRSPCLFSGEHSDPLANNNTSFHGNQIASRNQATHDHCGLYVQPPAARRKTPDIVSQQHRLPLTDKAMSPSNSFLFEDNRLPSEDCKFVLTNNQFTLTDNISMLHFQW